MRTNPYATFESVAASLGEMAGVLWAMFGGLDGEVVQRLEVCSPKVVYGFVRIPR